jgi:hypothetical protein
MDIISSTLKAMTPIFEISLRVDLQIGFNNNRICSINSQKPKTKRKNKVPLTIKGS